MQLPTTLNRFRRLFWFSCSGSLALLLDFFLLWLLVSLGLPAWAARALSFVCSATFTWQFNIRITFRETAPRYGSLKGWASYMGMVLIGGMANYLASMLVLSELGDLGPVSLFAGVAAGSLAGLCVNFTLCSRWFFKKK